MDTLTTPPNPVLETAAAPVAAPVPLPPSVAPFVQATSPAARPQAPPARVRELAAAIGVALLADVVLWGGAGGLGFAALFGGVPLLVLAGRDGIVRSTRLVAVGVLLALVAARSAWQLGAWSVLCGGALLFAFALTAGSRETFLPELVVSSCGSLLTAAGTLRHWARGSLARVTRGRSLSLAWITVVVPAVVVSLFAIVLIAANPVLERWSGAAWDAITGGALLPSPLRVLLWGAAAWLAAAWLRPMHAQLLSSGRGDPHRLEVAPGVGPYRTTPERAPSDVAYATSRNVLVGVNALFVLYLALDVVHLWAGRVPEGMIHTDYAHRGAAWLTFALVLCTLVLSVMFRGEINFCPRAKVLRTLALAWIGEGLVLAAGTLRRIELYVEDSGLTNLRIVGFLGTVVVAVGLVLVAVKVARRQTLVWLVRRQLDALGITVVIFLVAPTDALVSSFNTARIARGELRPLLHLTEQHLSAEGASGIVPLLSHRDPIVSRGAAAVLHGLAERLDREEHEATRWSQRELARPLARAELARVRPRIAALLGPARDGVPADQRAWSELRRRACAANDLPCAAGAAY